LFLAVGQSKVRLARFWREKLFENQLPAPHLLQLQKNRRKGLKKEIISTLTQLTQGKVFES
jgi:hypothetical protein